MTHVHTLPVNVYYEDTDFTGVVYHANYLKYFERAREHMLGIEWLARLYREHGVGFVVHKVVITYKEPAVHGDTLEVQTTVRLESDYRAIFDHSIYRAAGSRFPLVRGEVHIVCVSKEAGLIAIPADIRAHLAAT